MAIAPTLQRYLDQNVTYGVIPHEPTMSSMRTAQICQISGDCLAKGIVLRHDGDYVLAVLPASHHIRLSELRIQLGDDVDAKTRSLSCSETAFMAQSPQLAFATHWMLSSMTASRSSRRSTWRAAITRR